MQDLIEKLKYSLRTESSLIDNLNQDERYTWQANYPVAVVHQKDRIKEDTVRTMLEQEGFLDKSGYTLHAYESGQIDFLRTHAPSYIKQVSLLCMQGRERNYYNFSQKRPHDFWKKVQNPGTFKAVVEISTYDGEEDICQIESELRDLMRSSKEVPSLKEIGFIWVATVPSALDIRKLFIHYFPHTYEIIAKNDHTTYIGWSNTLKEVNMRYFVCPVA